MSDLTRRAAHGTALHLGAQLAVLGSAYIVAVVLARALGPALYGVYGVVYSVLLTVELIGRLGIPQAVSKLVAERAGPSPHLEATGVTLALLVYLALFAGFWLAAPGMAALFDIPDGTRLFRIAALDIPFYGLYFMVVHILNGRRAFARESLASVLYGSVKAAGILVLAWLGPTLEGALIVNVLGSVVALGFVLAAVGRSPFRFTVVEARPILRLALPAALIGFGSQLLLALDLWALNVLGVAVAEAEKGLYVAASNIARIPNLLAFVMTAVLVPSLAHALAAGDSGLARRSLLGAMRFLAATLLPGCALIAANAGDIMALLFSEDYAAGAGLLATLIFAQGLGFTLFMTLGGVLMAADRAGQAAVLALGALPLALLLNTLLIPRLGAPGAALASLLSLGTAVLLAAVLVRRRIGALVDPGMLARTLLVTLVVGLAGHLIAGRGTALLLELAVLAGLALALLALLGVVSRADLEPFLPARLKPSPADPPAGPAPSGRAPP